MKKLKQLGLVMAVGILAFCMSFTGIAYSADPIGVSSANGALARNGGGPIITETAPLFNLDGTHNADLIAELMYLARNADYGAPNVMGNHVVTGITVSDAVDIRTANDGALPDIRLFEQHGTFSNTGMPLAGQVNTQSRDNFTHVPWRLVYITHSANSDPVFTFRMTGAYRNNRVHSVSANWGADIRYEGSDIRGNLTDDFNNVLDDLFYEHDDIHQHFIAPANIPGAWQNDQPDFPVYPVLGNPMNQALETGARNDLLWLPSVYEVGNSGGQNLWRLTNEERAHEQNGFTQWAWLRSSQRANIQNARMVRSITSIAVGAGDSYTVSNSNAIVPALHLSLGRLRDLVITSPDATFTGELEYGETITLTRTATSPTGQQFSHFTVNGVEIAGNTFTMPATDVTVAVVWENITYAISGAGVLYSGTLEYGETITLSLTATPPTGQQFRRFIINETPLADGATTFTMPASNVVVAIEWRNITFTVTFSVDGETYTVNNVVHGTSVTQSMMPTFASIPPGMAITGWTLGGSQVNPQTHNITSPATFVAVLEYRTYTVTFMVNNVPHAVENVRWGTATTIPTLTIPAGNQITGWTVAGASANPATHNITSTTTFTAVLSEYITIGDTTILLEPGTLYLVEHLTEPTPPAGQEFAGWALYGTTAVLTGGFELVAGMELVALFQPISGDGFPWLILAIAIAGALLLIIGSTVFLVIRKRKVTSN